jgi:hypothetical protein
MHISEREHHLFQVGLLPICASTILVLGLMVAAGCFAPATAHAYTTRNLLDCGSGWDLCMQACDYSVPGGPPLGKCNDYCTKGTSVCEASRIPLPTRYRSRSHDAIGRK